MARSSVAARDDVGEVDEGARRGGDGDAVARRDALAVERRPVHHAPRDASASLGAVTWHVLTAAAQHAPQNGGTDVAERRPLAASEHRSHEATVTR